MEMKNKVTIIGAGQVGSTTAYSLVASDVCQEIALIDINPQAVGAQVMDLQHSVPLWGYTNIKVGTYQDLADSKVVIITAGAPQATGMSRLDLIKTNSELIKKILPKVFKTNPKIIVVMVTNPVDILTQIAIKMYPQKKKQIIGSGTILDSARFKSLLGQELNINPESIHGYIVGEHGDSEVALWSTVDVGSTPLDKYKKISLARKKKIAEEAKNAAYSIIEGKQYTNFGIASALNKLVTSILDDKRTVLPVSHLLEGQYGISGICLSLPAVIGASGIIAQITPKISADEISRLKKSAAQLKKVFKKI